MLVIQSTGVDARGTRVPLRPGQSTPFVDKVLEHRPGTPVEVIPGIGHFTMHEAADRVTDLVRGFATRVAARV
jgi:pimeloyl-ACP methyl ester carboxylesterase